MLPPGITSRTQQMDMGVIANFKYHYRSMIVKKNLIDISYSTETNIDVT